MEKNRFPFSIIRNIQYYIMIIFFMMILYILSQTENFLFFGNNTIYNPERNRIKDW